MGYDSLIDHFTRNEYEYNFKFMAIGFANFAPNVVMRGFLMQFAI